MSDTFQPKGEHETFVWREAQPQLKEGERAYAVAYFDTLDGGSYGGGELVGGVLAFVDVATSAGYHALITDTRILLIKCRLGAFGPLQENRGVSEIPLSSIVSLKFDRSFFGKKRKRVSMRLSSGSAVFNVRGRDKHYPSQAAFLDLLEQRFGPAAH
jgi:hypothetical protein